MRFSIFKIQFIYIVKSLVGITDNFPIDEIVRFHDWNTGTHMHGGATHIVGVADPDHRHVGNIRKNNGVFASPSTALFAPLLQENSVSRMIVVNKNFII